MDKLICCMFFLCAIFSSCFASTEEKRIVRMSFDALFSSIILNIELADNAEDRESYRRSMWEFMFCYWYYTNKYDQERYQRKGFKDYVSELSRVYLSEYQGRYEEYALDPCMLLGASERAWVGDSFYYRTHFKGEMKAHEYPEYVKEFRMFIGFDKSQTK